MRTARASWIFVLLPALPPLACAADDCGALERRLDAQLSTLAVVADQLGAFRSLGDAALAGVKTCPHSARLWYLAARSAEVLEAPLAGAAFPEYGGTKGIARQAAAHAPESAAIATIVARLDGTMASARRAHGLDPRYRPARRAFAMALGRKGEFEDALKLVTPPGAGSEDRLARARLLLDAGQPREAAAEARRALEHPQADPAEPAPSIEIVREGNEILGFALLAQGRTRAALRPLRAAASTGSRAAQAELAKRR